MGVHDSGSQIRPATFECTRGHFFVGVADALAIGIGVGTVAAALHGG